MRKVIIVSEGRKPYNGYFHQWGLMEGHESTVSCAIVEDLKGNVETVYPWEVRFVEGFSEENK